MLNLIATLSVLLCFVASLNGQTRSTKPVAVFDVQQNTGTIYISPIVIFDKGSFNYPFSTRGGTSARKRFVEKYFAPGKTYILVFGGGNAGSVKITSAYWQDGAYAYGELTESEVGRIRGQIHGLATDFDTTARGGPWRRSPNADERAEAIDLAKSELAKQDVNSDLIPSIEVLNLTAIDVDGDNKAELVGSFKVPQRDKQKPPHMLFLIAQLDGQHFKTARANYQFNPNSTEYPLGMEMLADNLDIDGDGVNEIVSVFTGPAYKDFFIVYQRKSRQWTQVYSGAGVR